MKKIIWILTLFIFVFSSLQAESQINFSGGRSALSLRNGKEEVTLSEGATVSVDSLVISSAEINLSGDQWRYVRCKGLTDVVDAEREISIETTSLWFDREEERLLISSWFELDDNKQELNATGGSLSYDMKAEILELSMQVMLLKITDDGLMRCQAESVIYDRNSNKLTLRGSAKVYWKGNEYEAEVISVDLDTDSITLEGRIKGNING